VAALIRAKYPGLQPELVVRAIIESTTHRPPGGYNTYKGFGEVNAAAAVHAAAALARSQRAPPAMRFDPAAAIGGPAAQAPVKIIYHDDALLALWSVVGAAGGLGFIAALVAAAVLVRRGTRGRSRQVRDVGSALPGGTGFPP